MLENPTKNAEKNPESIPTIKEVQEVFDTLLGDLKPETIRQLEDQDGLYLWDIKVIEEDGHREYSYIRKGRYKEGQSSATVIHVIFHDKEGIPRGGHNVANFVNNKWELVT